MVLQWYSCFLEALGCWCHEPAKPAIHMSCAQANARSAQNQEAATTAEWKDQVAAKALERSEGQWSILKAHLADGTDVPGTHACDSAARCLVPKPGGLSDAALTNESPEHGAESYTTVTSTTVPISSMATLS